MLFDLPLDQLKTYLPPLEEPADFDAFWTLTLAEANRFQLSPTFQAVDYYLRALETFDVTFNGYNGQPIKGWLILPRQREGALPCILEFIGYGGGRGFPLDWLVWASSGFAHFVMDTRGQGSTWRQGDTPDIQTEGSNAHYPGFMTLGVLDPKTYYYRRVFTDAARAVQAARSHPAVDSRHIAVTGGSQGGGIALAVSALVPDIQVTMPDVPFLCHYRRATELVDTPPYNEISRYCKTHRDKVETVFRTLSYFDGVNFAVRARAQAFFSTALMDDTCPPSTVFAAYNHYAGPKQIQIWPYNQHEGGGTYQMLDKLKFLSTLWQV